MDFTGECIVPECRNSHRELFLWHMTRYEFAKQYVQKSDTVLDVACGTGYGTYELGMLCRQAVGLDISGEAIRFARDNYHAKNIIWHESDCTKMEKVLEDSLFDVIISFETIEHLHRENQHAFIAQIANFLKKEGIAIISTPNVEIYGSHSHLYGKGSYHQHEMNKVEFVNLLKTRFDQVYLLGQSFSEAAKSRWQAMKMAAIVNGIFKLNFRPIVEGYDDYMDEIDFEFSPDNLDRALILIAICRNAK